MGTRTTASSHAILCIVSIAHSAKAEVIASGFVRECTVHGGGVGYDSKACPSTSSITKFATVMDTGEPTAVPNVCC